MCKSRKGLGLFMLFDNVSTGSGVRKCYLMSGDLLVPDYNLQSVVRKQRAN